MAPGVFLYYPGHRQMMPKLRAFIDHVKSRSGATNKPRSHIDDKRTRGMQMRRRGKRGPEWIEVTMCVRPRCETYRLLLQRQHRIRYFVIDGGSDFPIRLAHQRSSVLAAVPANLRRLGLSAFGNSPGGPGRPRWAQSRRRPAMRNVRFLDRLAGRLMTNLGRLRRVGPGDPATTASGPEAVDRISRCQGSDFRRQSGCHVGLGARHGCLRSRNRCRTRSDILADRPPGDADVSWKAQL
jgi:hypothetical protein